jgi:hypothetical protein
MYKIGKDRINTWECGTGSERSGQWRHNKTGWNQGWYCTLTRERAGHDRSGYDNTRLG